MLLGVRLRFTVLYAVLFLVSGIGLLALAGVLSDASVTQPAPGQQQPPATTTTATTTTLTAAQERIRVLEAELADIHQLQSRQVLVGSVVALGVMAVLSIVLGNVMAVRVLRPLRTITAATRRITAENLHERLAVPGPADEVKDLADTVDGLLQRLETSFAAQRRFVANASHELRTPLATMRASLDVALAKPEPAPPPQTVALAQRLHTELDRIDGLLEGLLVLARAQHGALAKSDQVDLSRLVRETLTAREPDIAAKHLTVEAEALAGPPAHGSEALLSRLVGNVIDNAIVHNEDAGWVRITATGTRLTVESGGPVLDPAHVARLAQPFQRLSADRTGSERGSGLGLSIVAAIVDAHGGSLELNARAEGGLAVTIVLPETGTT